MLHTLGSMALAGLAYSSGSTLWGGWVTNRRQMNIQHDSQAFQGQLEAKRQAFQGRLEEKRQAFQAELAERQQEFQGRLEENRQAFQAELAERQQAFQAALAERNFQQSAQLQREITAMKAALDRDLQEQRFAHDLEMWSRNQFVNSVWPLINTPDGYVDYLKQLGCPMSVIVTGKLEDRCSNILSAASGFINAHYANQQHIYYYNQGWKENMRNRQGNAQRDAIHQGLNGLPTLVVMPDIENGDFKLDVSFWGFGESMPQTVSVFKRNWQQMEMEILRGIARQWNGRPLPPTSNPKILSIQANIETARKEEEYRQTLRAEGKYSEEEIETWCDEIFAPDYKKTGLEADVAGGISQIAGAPIAVASGLYADAFLLGAGSMPKLPALMKEFPESVQEEMGPQIVQFYSDLTKMMNELERPKACALIACAYMEGGNSEEARHFQEKALTELQNFYAKRQDLVFPHWEAVEIIRKNPLFGTGEYPYLLLEAEEPKPAPISRKAGEQSVKTVDGIEYAFRWCPAGTFMMGSPTSESGRSNGETQHKVTLTRGFWMLETEVTQAMWESVMGENPSDFKGDQNPVERVSWDDSQDFCGKLSSKLGAKVNLPTEAQWEYACRAGTTTAYSFGSSLNGREANITGDFPCGTSTEGPYLEETTAVRSYSPNAWGLYDMHGNVWEWCLDTYESDFYAKSPTSDPLNSAGGSDRVFRGGSWFNDASYCRSAIRRRAAPGDRYYNLGFRIVWQSSEE